MAKISLVKCDEYEYSRVRVALEESISQMGGLEPYIQKGMSVLLKVNLLMKRSPESATTTHPVFTQALADILSDYGVTVIIGDSPGGPFSLRALNNVYQGSGYDVLHQPVKQIYLNQNIQTVSVIRDDLAVVKQLRVIEVLQKVDKVISVSKLKTHGMMVFTGAVKNMFGTIPGIHKAEYHFKMPKIEDFSQMLVDVCINASPVLSFMDGIIGMEGAGPSSGDPVKIGAIIVSDSPYHLDMVATQLVGIPYDAVPTIQRCIERGLVRADGEDIQMTGIDIGAFDSMKISHPRVGGVSFVDERLPSFLKKPIINLMSPKPIFNGNICVKCGECERACPSHAITMGEDKPIVDMDSCIRCFCCQELCPHQAVTIHRNPLWSRIVRM
jgi:uncharacterized protein (DUF362 family)/Pyruvate/2-oxoacid:ferredoxin oxidoreductase delta subunit